MWEPRRLKPYLLSRTVAGIALPLPYDHNGPCKLIAEAYTDARTFVFKEAIEVL
jgi:hypothetical protein